MTERTCSADDCDRKHVARGLCSMHWKREYGTRTKYPIVCAACGDTWLSERATGKYCSDPCKGRHYSETMQTKCPLPDDHAVMVLIAQAKVARAAQAAEQRRERDRIRGRSNFQWRTARECPGCACTFTPLYTSTMLTCSLRCARRISRRRRRAREAGAYGSWVWSDFMRVARRFNYCCAYCGAKPGQLDPDHVVPLSRGGHDSTTNLLPSCRQCNGDKRDLLLGEWALDREARGKAPRMTNWAPEDKRYWHLTQAILPALARPSISPAA
jgi:5-methylcytosine-specific restriction endonuclease McrA